MADAELLFKRLLTRIRPVTEAHGFRRRSQNFVRESPECWGIINFQKSRQSSTSEKAFTVNLAVASKRILAFNEVEPDKVPVYSDGSWKIRVGELMPDHQDKWWTLSDESAYPAVESEIQDAILLSAPIINAHLSDDGLVKLWNSKRSGSFEYPRLKDKAVLLAAHNKLDELPEIFQRIRKICRGTTAETHAEEHIAKLKAYYSLPF